MVYKTTVDVVRYRSEISQWAVNSFFSDSRSAVKHTHTYRLCESIEQMMLSRWNKHDSDLSLEEVETETKTFTKSSCNPHAIQAWNQIGGLRMKREREKWMHVSLSEWCNTVPYRWTCDRHRMQKHVWSSSINVVMSVFFVLCVENSLYITVNYFIVKRFVWWLCV